VFVGSFQRLWGAAEIVLLLTACSGGGGGAGGASLPLAATQTVAGLPDNMTVPVPARQMYWIVSESGIEGLETKMSAAEVQSLFNGPRTFEIMNMLNKADPLPTAKHLLYYRDETLIANDLASGKFNRMDGALYDDESYQEPGNTTPADQIANPIPYAQVAASALHKAGKLFVYTVGQRTGTPGSFLTQTLPSVAPYPDAIDFQTQAAEGTTNFAREVANYASVYKSHGGHIMLFGIGADPMGRAKTAADIESAYVQATKNSPTANGFWLNLAVKSQSCLGCAAQINYPPVLSFLSWLGY